jgi:hypothetical protein
MIINSDERQWSWMDEGLNTFVQYLTEEEWDNNYPSQRGPARKIVDYMKLPKEQLEPIMTNSDNIVQFGPNAYSKPATALNILRETVMGRELFDYAFKEYARRWAFKHPTPADFFRTMEDASAVDLDWYWRGWFFSIDAVDISLDTVKWFKIDMDNNPRPQTMTQKRTISAPDYSTDISKIRNREEAQAGKLKFAIDEDPSLRDFYNDYKPWLTEDSVQTMTMTQPMGFQDTMTAAEKMKYDSKNYYELTFSNKGGLVMPLIIEWTYADGTKEIERIPAQIWRKNENKVVKVFMKDKEVTGIRLDPMKETADINEANNNWPVKQMPSRFQVYKSRGFGRNQGGGQQNPMQKAKAKDEKKPF